MLFWELALIRWLPAYFRLFSFFSNFVLLAAFAGTGLGLLSRSDRAAARTPVLLLALAAATTILFRGIGMRQFGLVGESGEVFFGFGGADWLSAFEWVLLPYCVLLVALFHSLGRRMGAAMEGLPPLVGYGWNLAGSLAGVAGFSALSGLGVAAPWWWAIGLILLVPDFWGLPRPGRHIPALALCAFLAFLIDRPLSAPLASQIRWSPYYRITYWPEVHHLSVNGIAHQNIHPRADPVAAGYEIPLRLVHAAREDDNLGDVLLIGAGTGNDLAAALAGGASSVDAVEIDPEIYRLGLSENPDRPYNDPRVRVVIDDGRTVLRHPPKKYGTIVYGVVDSLTLLSGYGKARLETYLFTREAFRDARAALAPDGVFVIYNDFREGWIEEKCFTMLAAAFDTNPLVFSYAGGKIFVAGSPATIARLAARTTEGETVPAEIFRGSPYERMDAKRMRPVWSGRGEVATDDWPFFYLRGRNIPAHNLRGLAVVMFVGIGAWLLSGRAQPVSGAAPMSLLGAAFLLLETVAVARVALLVGSTWWTNAAVFSTVLSLAFAGVLLARTPLPMWIAWCGLFGSILELWLTPPDVFLGLPGGTIVAAAVSAAPCLFASWVFSRLFARSRTPDIHLGWNLVGAVMGGCLEYAALVSGYRALLLLAMGLYAGAALTSRAFGQK